MDRMTESSADQDFHFPPPPADDEFVDTSYVMDPADVSYDVNRSFTTHSDPPPPYYPEVAAPQPDDQFRSFPADETPANLSLDHSDHVSIPMQERDSHYRPTHTQHFEHGVEASPAETAQDSPAANGDVLQGGEGQYGSRRVLNDSLDSVVLEEDPPGVYTGDSSHLGGVENEAYSYDADADTDLSLSFQGGSPADPPVVMRPDPFPILDRPTSGRYQKNPSVIKHKPSAPSGPYDPNIGVFLAPPVSPTKKDGPAGSSNQVRRRIPRPPSRWKFRCAYLWSCIACLVGNFLCAIPAFRYVVTANESRRIGDYNSAHSYLRKTAILATVALVLAVAAWTLVILHLSDVF